MSQKLDGPYANEQANKVKKNGLLVMKGMPCKVLDVRHFKTGKHGSGKNAFVGICLFSKKKAEESFPSSSNVLVPKIEVNNYFLSDMEVSTSVHPKTKKDHKVGNLSGMNEDDEEVPDLITINEVDHKDQFLKITGLLKKMNDDDDYDKDVVLTIKNWGDKSKYKLISEIKEQ